MKTKKDFFIKVNKIFVLTICTALLFISSITLSACNPVPSSSNPDSVKSRKTTEGEGGVALKFDMGQTLNQSDFLLISDTNLYSGGGDRNDPGISSESNNFSTKSLTTLQQAAAKNNFDITDIEKATVIVTSPYVLQPATVTLTKQDIISGWYYMFADIPTGEANVSLEIFDAQNKTLFSETRDVDVFAGTVTPVDFSIELGEDRCNTSYCTGSIAVTVKAITACCGRIKVEPAIAKLNQPITVSISELKGNVERYIIDFGDGTSAQTVNSLPVSHNYTKSGRHAIKVTMTGTACKNDFTTTSYVSIDDSTATATFVKYEEDSIDFSGKWISKSNATASGGNSKNYEGNDVTSIQDNNPSLKYTGTWINYSNIAPDGGSLKYTNTSGNSVSYEFTGKSSIMVFSTKYTNRGKALLKLYKNNVEEKQLEIDLYNPNVLWNQLVGTFDSLLPSEQYKITMEATGLKNNNSSDTFIDIDAFKTIQTETSTAVIKFTGTGINVYGLKSNDYGNASFTLDNGKEEIVDCYSSTTKIKELLKSYTGLTDTDHTIVIKVLNDKNSASTGNNFSIDYYEVESWK